MNDLEQTIRELAHNIRSNQLKFGNVPYSLGILMSVWQSKLLEIPKIYIVELGVASGNGLLAMIKCADYYKKVFDIDFEIIGFDTGTGMPAPTDYRDHPELWKSGDFSPEIDLLLEKIDNKARIIFGNVDQTIKDFCKTFSGVLGYCSIDLDHYTSTVNSFPLFEMSSDKYLPATPLHVDDIHVNFLFNPWCGESLAIKEFNDKHEFRKIHEKSFIYNISNLHALHVLDHPCLNESCKYPVSCGPF